MLHTHTRRLALLILLLSSALLQPGTISAHARPAPAQARLSALPLSFVPNRGQTDSSVRFVARGLGGAIFFTAREVVLSLANGRSSSPAVLRLRWAGASAAPSIAGVERQAGVVSYLTGADATRWQRALPTYAGVRYRQLYPGIDLRYDGLDGQLKSTYLVAAGADASRIRWHYDGAERVALADDGSLQIDLAQGGTLREAAPVAWQDIAGQRHAVAVRYRIERGGRLGFALGSYDRTQPLVIDPTLSYSTFLGGSGNDLGYSIAIDSAGNAYIAGETASLNFPTASALQPTRAGGIDAFVAKLNASGSALSFSTYLGGTATDRAYGIALDGSGNAYLVGSTSSANFPTVNPIQASYAGGNDAVAAKISAAGTALVYSTYLGGSNVDTGLSIAVGDDGSAHLTGYSRSTNYPTASPLRATLAGNDDVIVSSLNPGGSALSFSTYLGGTSQDWGYGIRVDSAGALYITGYTFSSGFPTASPLQPTRAGGADAIVAKITP